MQMKDGRALREPALALRVEPPSSGSLAPAGFDPARMNAADRIRLRNAGSNFGRPEFNRLACEWMTVQGFAKPRREKGRWRLTALGRELQRWVLGRDSDQSGEAGQTAEQAGPEGRERGAEGNRPNPTGENP